MTKFSSILPKQREKTTFLRALASNGLVKTDLKPEQFEEVVYLGYDKVYGDTFKAIDTDGSFTIFFGVKGSEFN